MNSISMSLMWLAVGAVVGWGASMIIRTSGKQAVVLDAVFGALGGVSGGFAVTYFFAQRLGEQTFMVSVAAACVCAVAMISLWRLMLLPQTSR